MSVKVNDVRATSADLRYAGVEFSGDIDGAIAQAKASPEFPLQPLDIRAPKGMSRDRAALLGFLRLLPANPLALESGVPFSVLSAERGMFGKNVNAERTIALQRALDVLKLQYAAVTGSYKGSEEDSFAVLTPSWDIRLAVDMLAKQYEQESILHVDANRYGSYYYLETGVHDAPRKWSSVSAGHASTLDGWTRDASGQFYTLKSLHGDYTIAYAVERGWL